MKPSGLALSGDEPAPHVAHALRSLRLKRNISLDALSTTTKVRGELLREFERDLLTHNPHFNKIYAVALARSYASTLGADEAAWVMLVRNAWEGFAAVDLVQ
jgi:cytoskeletal protein RodZ